MTRKERKDRDLYRARKAMRSARRNDDGSRDARRTIYLARKRLQALDEERSR